MKIGNTLDNQDMTKQQEEMNDRIQDLHNWYIGGQIILHPERDEVFKNKLLTFLQSEIDLAVAEERKRIVEIIEGFEVYDDEADNCRRFISNTISLITKEN